MATLGLRHIVRSLDVGIFAVPILLVIFGLAALFSFSIHLANPDYSLLVKQGVLALIGLMLAIGLMRVDHRWLGGLHWVLYVLAMASLVLVLVAGQTIRGHTGWFVVGGIQLQPVEFVKIVMAIVLAKLFANQPPNRGPWRTIAVTGLVTAIPTVLVMMQPDLGSTVIIVGMWLGLLLIAPVPRRTLLALLLLLVVAGVSSWFLVLHPYQKDRVLNFLAPGRDPLGSGYNARQAMTAIGSGQWFGRGLGLGPQSQLNFLPERQTDFIFASIGEELGLLGGGILLALYALFFWRLKHAVDNIRDRYSAELVVALSVMFFLQVFINIGMNMGLFPVTGIPLPFLSYGGSSLLASLLAIGLIEGVIIRQRTHLA